MSPRSTRPPALRQAATQRFATPVSGDVEEPAIMGAGLSQPPPPPPSPIVLDNVVSMPVAAPDVTFEPPTIEDRDRLWDWVRADRPGTTGFLGREHKTTATFFAQLAEYDAMMQGHTAWFQAIRQQGVLIGFVALTVAPGQHASVAFYIEPGSRSALDTVVAETLPLIPEELHLMAITNDPDMIAAFAAHGFTQQTLLSRHRQTSMTGGDPFQPPKPSTP